MGLHCSAPPSSAAAAVAFQSSAILLRSQFWRHYVRTSSSFPPLLFRCPSRFPPPLSPVYCRLPPPDSRVTPLDSETTPLRNHILLSEPCSDGLTEISDEVVLETRRLVETAMLSATTGLAYFLSNSLRIENYFGCFFPLPVVISSLRWGAAASRKTMVATAMLLLVLAGPIRAASYLLMHGFLGLAMGALWRLEVSWGVSLLICTLVRSLGAIGFVLLSSWLLRDNLLVLITINAHASIAYMLSAMGLNLVPSMGTIYFIFGALVLLNCGSFVFLLHVLYVIFQKRMGLQSSLRIPSWLKTL